MPAKSVEQATAARLALAAKLGKVIPAMLYGAAKKMYESMTVEQLKHFTKRPTKKRRRKKH